MYYLMNKDNIIAKFAISQGLLGNVYTFKSENNAKLPYGFTGIENWLDNRKASKHNSHLRELMIMCGCDKPEGFIKITHAASLNDTFWVKSDTENARWVDISFYTNEFNETIAKLAFEGVGLYGIQLSSTSPDLSTNGSYPKCWRREEDEIWLYKRGLVGAVNAGLEPYCEAMASELASKICKNAVSYSITKLHGKLASKCHLFTSEKNGYVPYAVINGDKISADEMLRFYEKLGSEDDFRRMLIFDAISLNNDRHTGNHGVLVDNITLQPIKMAPVFDLNRALLPYAMEEDFVDIGKYLIGYCPKIGDDFTRIGQQAITSGIRSDLIGLKGFTFSFRGDDKFPAWRVKKMEEMVNRQIEALLSRDILYTKDIFVPKVLEEEKAAPDLHKMEQEAEQFGKKMKSAGICERYKLNDCADHFEVMLYPDTRKDEVVYVDPTDWSMWAEVCGNTASITDMVADYPELHRCFVETAKTIDNMYDRTDFINLGNDEKER